MLLVLLFTLFSMVSAQIVLQEYYRDCVEIKTTLLQVESLTKYFIFQDLGNHRKNLSQQYSQICVR